MDKERSMDEPQDQFNRQRISEKPYIELGLIQYAMAHKDVDDVIDGIKLLLSYQGKKADIALPCKQALLWLAQYNCDQTCALTLQACQVSLNKKNTALINNILSFLPILFKEIGETVELEKMNEIVMSFSALLGTETMDHVIQQSKNLSKSGIIWKNTASPSSAKQALQKAEANLSTAAKSPGDALITCANNVLHDEIPEHMDQDPLRAYRLAEGLRIDPRLEGYTKITEQADTVLQRIRATRAVKPSIFTKNMHNQMDGSSPGAELS
jgi:hypothetical protein